MKGGREDEGARQRERDRGRETERERQRERDRERETERDRDRQREGEREREKRGAGERAGRELCRIVSCLPFAPLGSSIVQPRMYVLPKVTSSHNFRLH